MKSILHEKKKINKGAFELQRRRLNWTFSAKNKIIDECKRIADMGNSLDYPFRLFCFQGSKDVNSETIQFGVGINNTGIEQVIEKVTKNGATKTRNRVLEKGCALVFSQGPTGTVAIMIYPYKSEVLERKEEFIFLHTDLHPDKITNKLICKCVMTCLFYARCSSVYGLSYKPTKLDIIKLFWLNFNDARSHSKRLKSFTELSNEWWKIGLASAITLSITLITQVSSAG